MRVRRAVGRKGHVQCHDILFTVAAGLLMVFSGLRAEGLSSLSVCAGPQWRTTKTAEDAMTYACEKPCAGEWSDCVYTMEGEEDSTGCPLAHLAFVVEGMGGQIRWSCTGKKTILFHVGGPGASWWIGEGTAQVWRSLEEEGVRIVEVKWEAGPVLLTMGSQRIGPGWLTRPSGEGTDLGRLTRRPGTVIKWVHDNLSSGFSFGTVGCSGGGLATLGPALFYHEELFPILDYQFVSGPALFWDVPAWCEAQEASAGFCEDNPEAACASDDDCTKDSAKCALLYPTNPLGIGVKAVVDYILGGGDDCRKGRHNPLMEASSVRRLLPAGNKLSHRHLIDFDFGEGGSTLMDDTLAGSTGHQAMIWRMLEGPKRWFDNEGFHHCASRSHPDLVPVTLERIREGMGLKERGE